MQRIFSKGDSKIYQKEWITEARKLGNELKRIYPGITICCYPIIKQHKGDIWSTTGYKMVISPVIFEGINPWLIDKHKKVKLLYPKHTVQYVNGVDVLDHKEVLASAEYFIERHMDELNRVYKGTYVVALYRKSGLIPKSVAEAHKKKFDKMFGTYPFSHSLTVYTEPHVTWAMLREARKYIGRFSKCPKCGNRGFQESIIGWVCQKCGQQVHDHGNHFEWRTKLDYSKEQEVLKRYNMA